MDSTMDYSAIPNCVFTHPELSTVGLTAKEAQDRGINVKTSVFKFTALGKALAMGQPEGFIKLVVEDVYKRQGYGFVQPVIYIIIPM